MGQVDGSYGADFETPAFFGTANLYCACRFVFKHVVS